MPAVELGAELGAGGQILPPALARLLLGAALERPGGRARQQHGGQARKPFAGVAIGVNPNPVAVLAAQKLIDGQLGRLAHQIPQRRVNAADGVVTHAGSSRRSQRRPHQPAQAVNVARVFARQEFIKAPDDARHAGRNKSLAPANQARVRADLDQCPVIIRFQNRCFYFCNAHCWCEALFPSFDCGARAPPRRGTLRLAGAIAGKGSKTLYQETAGNSITERREL